MQARAVVIVSPAALSLKDRSLRIERQAEAPAMVPVEDLGVVVVDYAATTLTVPLMSALASTGAAVAICDEKHMPVALMLPMSGSSLHAVTLRRQIDAPEPRRKRMWQAVVSAKIGEQARVLEDAGRPFERLAELARAVRSGDPDNCEGTAARIYWQALFGPEFRRDVEMPGTNAMLNYGYAVLRGAVARAVVGAGLHPALGIHHHNQYNSFALADDLMEPLRPMVDALALAYLNEHPAPEELTPATKNAMLQILASSAEYAGKRYPLATALELYLAGARAFLTERGQKMLCPGR